MSTAASALTSVETGLDTVWANTLGLVWSAATGTVDPWTKNLIVADAQTGVTKALGTGATQAQIDAATQGQEAAISSYLVSINANPSQASLIGGLSNSWDFWFGPNGKFNPTGWSATTILLIAGALIAIFAALGWGLHH